MLQADAFFNFIHLLVLLQLSAGAEILHEQVHQQHRAVGDDDQDGGEGAGQTVRALFGELVDLHGDEQELRCHQQNDGGNGGDVLIGEVSQCNDDNTDNRFEPPVGRFPAIEEDEKPYRLLCNEYPPAKD